MADKLTDYEFLPASRDDLEEFVRLGIEEFIRIEPHAVALAFTSSQSRTLFDWIMGKCLHHPYSLKVVEKRTGRTVALNAVSLCHRDSSQDWEPFNLDDCPLAENVQKLCALLGKCSEEFWARIEPGITTILHQEVVFVLPEHQRRGIASAMLNYMENVKAPGVQGISSDAMSLANQKLLAARGYSCVYEADEHDWFERIEDGAKGIKVMFKDLR